MKKKFFKKGFFITALSALCVACMSFGFVYANAETGTNTYDAENVMDIVEYFSTTEYMSEGVMYQAGERVLKREWLATKLLARSCGISFTTQFETDSWKGNEEKYMSVTLGGNEVRYSLTEENNLRIGIYNKLNSNEREGLIHTWQSSPNFNLMAEHEWKIARVNTTNNSDTAYALRIYIDGNVMTEVHDENTCWNSSYHSILMYNFTDSAVLVKSALDEKVEFVEEQNVRDITAFNTNPALTSESGLEVVTSTASLSAGWDSHRQTASLAVDKDGIGDYVKASNGLRWSMRAETMWTKGEGLLRLNIGATQIYLHWNKTTQEMGTYTHTMWSSETEHVAAIAGYTKLMENYDPTVWHTWKVVRVAATNARGYAVRFYIDDIFCAEIYTTGELTDKHKNSNGTYYYNDSAIDYDAVRFVNCTGYDMYFKASTYSTWKDTSTGLTYTFEGDIATHNATDIRDLGVHDLLYTAEGVTGYNVSNTNKYTEGDCMINDTDADWLKSSSGVAFKFKTDSEWYTPAGTENGSVQTAMNGDTWISVYYGDLWIQLSFGNWGLKTLYAKATSMTEAGSDVALTRNSLYYLDGNIFIDPDGNGKYEMSDWVDVYLTKTACTAVSNGSTPTGYWFKMTIGATINGTYKSTEVYNTYVNQPMYNSARNDFGIANQSLHRMTNPAFVCTEEAWKNHKNFLTVKSMYADNTATATVDTETYKDVGDMMSENSALADKYVMGFDQNETGRYYMAENFISGGTDESVGLEVRTKFTTNNMTTNVMPNDIYPGFMQCYTGATYLIFGYSSQYKKIQIMPYSFGGVERQVAPTTHFQWAFDVNAEYVWRITRTNVNFTDSSMAGKGAIIKVYMGKIDATTGEPESGWDTKPIYSIYDSGKRTSATTNRTGLGINATMTSSNDRNVIHFSSNKYVGVKMIIGDETIVNKVVRGSDYVFPTFDEENILYLGWSKGESNVYSAEDYVAPGTVLANLQTSRTETYKAYRVKLDAAPTASLRFRTRQISGRYLDIEVALKWSICAEILDDVYGYFGDYKFGYQLCIDYSLAGEEYTRTTRQVSSHSENIEGAYNYSIIQSGITETWYGNKFTCRAYIEVQGMKFFTPDRDMDTDGRSVDSVAEATIADIRDTEVTEGDWAYTNEIVDSEGEFIGYHYLSQLEYDFLTKVAEVY